MYSVSGVRFVLFNTTHSHNFTKQRTQNVEQKFNTKESPTKPRQSTSVQFTLLGTHSTAYTQQSPQFTALWRMPRGEDEEKYLINYRKIIKNLNSSHRKQDKRFGRYVFAHG